MPRKTASKFLNWKSIFSGILIAWICLLHSKLSKIGQNRAKHTLHDANTSHSTFFKIVILLSVGTLSKKTSYNPEIKRYRIFGTNYTWSPFKGGRSRSRSRGRHIYKIYTIHDLNLSSQVGHSFSALALKFLFKTRSLKELMYKGSSKTLTSSCIAF